MGINFKLWLESKKKMILSMATKSPEELEELSNLLNRYYEEDEKRTKHMSHMSNTSRYFPGGPNILSSAA